MHWFSFFFSYESSVKQYAQFMQGKHRHLKLNFWVKTIWTSTSESQKADWPKKIWGNIFISLSYFLYFSMIFEQHGRDSGVISETLSTKQFFNTLILILLRITISFPQGTLLCFDFKDRHAQSTLDLWDWHQRWAKSEYICYQVPISLCLNWAYCVQCNCVLC